MRSRYSTHEIGRRACRIAVGQPQVLGRDHDAGRQSLQVPFERRRQRLVEIVDVEDDVALWRREAAEIHQVGIAAGLHSQPAGRCVGQVGGHQRRRATIEREGRGRHAPEADRHQARQSPYVGFADDLDRIAPTLGRLPSCMSGARRRIAQGLALDPAFIRRPVGRRGLRRAIRALVPFWLGFRHGCSSRRCVADIGTLCCRAAIGIDACHPKPLQVSDRGSARSGCSKPSRRCSHTHTGSATRADSTATVLTPGPAAACGAVIGLSFHEARGGLGAYPLRGSAPGSGNLACWESGQHAMEVPHRCVRLTGRQDFAAPIGPAPAGPHIAMRGAGTPGSITARSESPHPGEKQQLAKSRDLSQCVGGKSLPPSTLVLQQVV